MSQDKTRLFVIILVCGFVAFLSGIMFFFFILQHILVVKHIVIGQDTGIYIVNSFLIFIISATLVYLLYRVYNNPNKNVSNKKQAEPPFPGH